MAMPAMVLRKNPRRALAEVVSKALISSSRLSIIACKIALGAGYPRAHAFDELADFTRELPAILGRPGPVFVALKVYPEIENDPIGRRRRWQTRTREQVLADLRSALEVAAS